MSIVDIQKQFSGAGVSLSLDNSPAFTGTASLEGESYTYEVMFATKQEQWYISLWDKDSLPIISGKALLPEVMIDVPVSSKLKGVFYLAGPTNGYGKWDTLKYDLANNYQLYYIY